MCYVFTAVLTQEQKRMPDFVCQNNDYYSLHFTEEIKVHKSKKTNKNPHLKQKGRGEVGKEHLFTDAGPGGSDGLGLSAFFKIGG